MKSELEEKIDLLAKRLDVAFVETEGGLRLKDIACGTCCKLDMEGFCSVFNGHIACDEWEG
jgi:hypothetical protein